MYENLIYIEHFASGCRLLHIHEGKPIGTAVDLDISHQFGDIYVGRVVGRGATCVWVDIGAGKPALLKCRRQKFHEGQAVTVRITREACQNAYENKGPQVVLEPGFSPHGCDQKSPPFLLKKAWPRWVQYLVALPPADQATIILTHEVLFQQAQRYLADRPFKLVLQQCQDVPFEVTQHWEDILSTAHPLPQGGYLLLEEAITLTAFDINTSAIDAYSTGRDLVNAQMRLRFNQQAAHMVLQLIALRHLGGTIVVDFLKLDDHRLQQHLVMTLKEGARQIKGLRILGFTPGGLVEMQRPVNGPTLKQKIRELKRES